MCYYNNPGPGLLVCAIAMDFQAGNQVVGLFVPVDHLVAYPWGVEVWVV